MILKALIVRFQNTKNFSLCRKRKFTKIILNNGIHYGKRSVTLKKIVKLHLKRKRCDRQKLK